MERFLPLVEMTPFCRVMEDLSAASPPPSLHPASNESFRTQRSGVMKLPQSEAAKVPSMGFRGANNEMRKLIKS